MIDTLIKSLQLKMTYSVNTFFYALQHTPLIKRIVPDSLYGFIWLKNLLTALAVIKEFISAFFGKFVYVAIFIGLPLAFDFFRGDDAVFPAWGTVLQVFILLTIVGGLTNNDFLNGSMDKYYAVFLLRMDPKMHAISNYAYLLFKFFLGFTAVGIVGALILDAPLWQGMMIPFFVVGVKLIFSAILVKNFERAYVKGKETAPRSFVKAQETQDIRGYIKTFLVGPTFAAAYLPAALGFIMPVSASLIIMAIGILGGVVSIFVIRGFKHYRKRYQKGIAEFMELQMMTKTQMAALDKGKIDEKRVVTSNKDGFEFLNELFVKRHRKILWRSARNTAVIIAGAIAIGAAAMFIVPDVKGAINSTINEKLSMVALLMYFVNKGQNYTRALFSNCDHSLLTYPIYRKGSNILKLFRLRLIEISKVNMVPAAVIAIGLALLLYLSGGTENPLYYLVVVVSVLALGIFFSVHYLTLYYLLQPFNANTEIKRGVYSIATFITYFVCYMMTQIKEIPAMGFGLVAGGFCIIYSIAACILAYTLAPRTFKLRN